MNPNRAWRCHYIIPLPFQWLNRRSERRIQLRQQRKERKKCDNCERDGCTCTEGSHLSRLHVVCVFIAFSGFICLRTSLQLLYIDPGMKEFIETYGITKVITWPITVFSLLHQKVWTYPDRLKRRRQLKQSQSEKSVNEQNPAIISCPDIPNDSDPNKKTDLQRTTGKPPAGSGKACVWTSICWNIPWSL